MSKDALVDKHATKLGAELGLWPYFPAQYEIEKNDDYKRIRDYLNKFYEDCLECYFNEDCE